MTLFHLIVPAPVCDSAPVSEDGVITISWTYVHTGGLNLTQVEVQYKEPTQDQFEGNETLDDPNQTSLSFTGLEAGSTYLFQIIAYNANGSDNVTCPPVTHEIGKFLNFWPRICTLIAQCGLSLRQQNLLLFC